MSSKTILIETDAGGAFTYERPLFGAVIAIAAFKDELSDFTTITISDPVSDTTVHTFEEFATDQFWQPGNPVAVYGTIRVDVTSGGDTKHGSIRLLLET